MATIYKRAFKNKWLGQPATAQGVVPKSAGFPVPDGIGQPVRIIYARLQNRSTGAAGVALVALLNDREWIFGQVDAAGAYTDDTVDAQSAATNDAALDGTAANAGFVIGATMPFGAVSVDCTTAGAGTTPSATHDIAYWNGSAWTQIAAAGLLVDVPRASDWATGEQLILLDPPSDWVTGGSGTGVPQTTYNLRVRRTALPTVGRSDALARRLYVGVVLASEDAVAANAIAELLAGDADVPISASAVGLAASVADEGHSLTMALV